MSGVEKFAQEGFINLGVPNFTDRNSEKVKIKQTKRTNWAKINDKNLSRVGPVFADKTLDQLFQGQS